MILEKHQTQNSLADLKNFAKSHLSIQISLDGFSYCVFDEELVDVVRLKSYEFSERLSNSDQLLQHIKEIFDTEPYLKNAFESVNVTYKNYLYTAVPSNYFDVHSLPQYLSYHVKVLDIDKVYYDEIENYDIVNVYIPYEKINRFLREIYIDFKIKHANSVFLNSIFKYFKNTSKPYFFINVTPHQLDLLYIANSELKLFNSFLYNTKEDFIYYVVYAMEQLDIDRNAQPVTLLGDILPDTPLYELLYKYVRHLNFLSINNFSLSDDFYRTNPHIAKHQFFELLNQF